MLRKIAILLIILTIFLGGCATHIGNFSAISTSSFQGKNIDSKHISMRDAKGISHCYYLFMIIPLCGGWTPKLDEAISRALSTGKGDFMQNVRIYDRTMWYIILTDYSFTVQGDVYNTASGD